VLSPLVPNRLSLVPHEFTSVPFPVKALKILIHDLQAQGDSATIMAQNESFDDVESDDGVSLTCSDEGVA
jgi:hypothetical protein